MIQGYTEHCSVGPTKFIHPTTSSRTRKYKYYNSTITIKARSVVNQSGQLKLEVEEPSRGYTPTNRALTSTTLYTWHFMEDFDLIAYGRSPEFEINPCFCIRFYTINISDFYIQCEVLFSVSVFVYRRKQLIDEFSNDSIFNPHPTMWMRNWFDPVMIMPWDPLIQGKKWRGLMGSTPPPPEQWSTPLEKCQNGAGRSVLDN